MPNSSGRHHSVRQLAWLMDNSIRLPGGYRIGLDGLLGLIPGIGDLMTGSIAGWIILQAHRAGAPRSVVARMIFNASLDTVVGSIPLVGDLFDFVFKANSRNLALLEQCEIDPSAVARRSRWSLAAVALGVLAAVVGLVWCAVKVTAALIAPLGA